MHFLELEGARSQMPEEVTGRSYKLLANTDGNLITEHRSHEPFVGSSQLQWYVVWTRARHEKCVSAHLTAKAFENFLPMYSTVRRWRNGDHRVELPLFPGYIFVRIRLQDELQVLTTAGVVRLVGFNGAPSPLEEEEIARLRRALASGVKAAPHPYLTVGRRVRITAGPLTGHQGLLVRRKKAYRIVLSVNLIQQSILVDADASSVEPIAFIS